MCPSPFKSCCKAVSSDSNAALFPDTTPIVSETSLPLLSVFQAVYWLAPSFSQTTSYPVAVCTAPIGAVQTATGYEVVWENEGANQYTAWNTDSNGNDVSDTIGVVSGNSAALLSLETALQQDLNGDGHIGLVSTVIQTDTSSFGSTSLTEIGNRF